MALQNVKSWCMSSFDWWRIPNYSWSPKLLKYVWNLMTNSTTWRYLSKFNDQSNLDSPAIPTWPIASVNHHAFTILPNRSSVTFHCINHWKWWSFGLSLGLFPQFQTALAKLWFSGMAVGLRGCVLKRGCDAESKSGYRWYRLMCPERFAVRTERKHAMQHYFTIPVPPRFT